MFKQLSTFKKKRSCLNRSISTKIEVSRQLHLTSIICKLIVTICAKVKEGSFNSTGSVYTSKKNTRKKTVIKHDPFVCV